MCTVTINFSKSETLITMNRDEDKGRHEEGLSLLKEGGIEVIFPIDIVSQGTWVATNNKGVTACLLNRYDALGKEVSKSRGKIIQEILLLGNIKKISAWMKSEFKPNDYAPFTLLLIAKKTMRRYDWDGLYITECDIERKDWYMTTSSSWNAEEVVRWRHQEFKKWRMQEDKFSKNLPSYNLLSEEGREEWSPFVEREKTHTKSITQISIRSGSSKTSYFPIEKLSDYSDPEIKELKYKLW